MSYFWISIKKLLNYKWYVLFSIISVFLTTATIIFLWSYIYRDNEDMRQYMTVYAILSSLLSLLYSNRCSECIADKVYKGTFAVDLLKPINFLKLNFIEVMGEIAAGLIVRGIPSACILFGLYWRFVKNIRPIHALLGTGAILLAFLFYMMLYAAIGFLSFWFYEIWPFNRLMNDTIRFFSGSVIPIALFPSWLLVPIKILPFQYLYSFPIELILKGNQCENVGQNFVTLLVWDAVIAAVMFFVYKRALFRCVVQGG